MQIDVNYFGLRETTALGFKRWRYLAVIQGNLRVESKVTMGVDSLTKKHLIYQWVEVLITQFVVNQESYFCQVVLEGL